MAWTSKVANVIKGKVTSMAMNAIGGKLASSFANAGQTKKIAAKLLGKSPLEIGNDNPTAHIKENPYSFHSEEGVYNSRFEVLYKVNTNDYSLNNDVVVYTSNNQLEINAFEKGGFSPENNLVNAEIPEKKTNFTNSQESLEGSPEYVNDAHKYRFCHNCIKLDIPSE